MLVVFVFIGSRPGDSFYEREMWCRKDDHTFKQGDKFAGEAERYTLATNHWDS